MQITFSFEAHELPAVLAQLLKLAGGDVSAIAAAAMSAPRTASEIPAPVVSVAPAAPQPSAEASAPVANEEPKKAPRGRPRTKDAAPHTEVVNPADLAPAVSSAPVAPDMTAAASPAASMPAVSTPTPAQAAAVAPNLTAGAPLTLEDLRDAYAAADERGATGEQILSILAPYKVAKVSLIPTDKWADAIAAFNALAR